MVSFKDRIIWLASYPKSGNTWLRLFLEAYVFGSVDINKLFYTSGDTNSQSYNPLSHVSLYNMHKDEIVYLRHAALMAIIQKHLFDPLFVKTHNAKVIIADVVLIPEYLTRSAIHIVRDPRDVVVSYHRHIGKSLDETIEDLGSHRASVHNEGSPVSYLNTWSLHTQTWKEADEFPVLTIKYEDMLKDPYKEFEKVIKHTPLRYNYTDLKKAVDTVAFDKIQRIEKKKGFKEQSNKNNQFFHKGKSQQWKERLSERQVKRIEQDHGEMMEIMGYKLEML